MITADPPASRRLYVEVLGLPLEGGDYIHSEKVEGCKSFGVWPLAQAAEACFGDSEWPADLPVPQASIEFEVASPEAVAAAAEELRGAGHALLTRRDRNLGPDGRARAVAQGKHRRDLLHARAARLSGGGPSGQPRRLWSRQPKSRSPAVA